VRAPLNVIKLGGRSLEAPAAVGELAGDLARLHGPAVLVHGGGAEVSAWSRRLGLEPRFVNGLRVTEGETLDVAVAVLAGLANKRLVALLRAAGIDAVGLSALDGGAVSAVVHPEDGSLGAAGRIIAVDPKLLGLLIEGGRTPVVASIAATAAGHLLNVNADDVAAALAVALEAGTLTLLSDVNGLQLDGELVTRIEENDLADILNHPDVTGGMRPKLAAAAVALKGGVPRVHIGAWSGAGTLEGMANSSRPATLLHAETEDSTWQTLHS
jgi:acetylglutamate kinase